MKDFIIELMYHISMLTDNIKGYIHLRIKRRKPLWSDSIVCSRRYCKYCGGQDSL
jgi:hypothetical protein